MSIKMIWTTCTKQEAKPMVHHLLQSKLIACANIFAEHQALYWWNDEICEDDEVTIIMETHEETLSKALSELTQKHSYETPKIMVFEPESVPEPFLKWLKKELDIRDK